MWTVVYIGITRILASILMPDCAADVGPDIAWYSCMIFMALALPFSLVGWLLLGAQLNNRQIYTPRFLYHRLMIQLAIQIIAPWSQFCKYKFIYSFSGNFYFISSFFRINQQLLHETGKKFQRSAQKFRCLTGELPLPFHFYPRPVLVSSLF